ncbi:MAG TPA: hypothetical protein PLJ11_09050, partial [Methanomassiliicoccales archaeon]|nr:hypothetical protein [Methanomassiliicoccales archaeon]
SGSISLAIGGISVRFTAQGGSAVNGTAVTTADGSFTASLYPGMYTVSVDQDIDPGDPSERYQSLSAMDLEVKVGSDPEPLAIEVVTRVLVNGAVSPNGSATIVFDGPERTVISARATYSLYLLRGSYSVYVQVNTSALRSASLQRMDVSGPTTEDLVAESAAQVVLRAQLSGVSAQAVELSIEHAGAYYNTTTATSGTATVYLPNGAYTVSVDHATTATLRGVLRHVRYIGQANFSVSGTFKNVVISTTYALNNATVHGQVLSSGAPTAASLRFEAQSATAISLSVDALGSYSVQLAVGSYSVYAVSTDSSHAYLGTLEVGAPGDIPFNISLREAFRLSGVTFANDEGVRA